MMNILAPNANNLKDAKAHRDVITQVFSDMPAHQALQNNAEFVKSDFEALLDAERPILYLHRAKLEARVRLFKDFFPGTVSFAVKANDSDSVFRALNEIGLDHYDVASIYEMKDVSRFSKNPTFHYHNPIRSRIEIEAAYSLYNCRRFVVDSIAELEKLHDVITHQNPEAAKDIELAVRLTMPKHEDSVQDFSKKFGASQTQCQRLLARGNELGYQMGMTFHVGSQCLNHEAYELHIKECQKSAAGAGVALKFINVGGGFPAPYLTTEIQDIKSNEDNLKEYFDVIKRTTKACFPDQLPALECEPGRALVATAFTLRTTIKAVRDDSGELFLNDGIYGALMEGYQFSDLMPQYQFISSQDTNASDELCEWTAYGPTCDPIDVLPFKLSLPKTLVEGDKIDFIGAGAYSLATSTRFNGYGDLKFIECE